MNEFQDGWDDDDDALDLLNNTDFGVQEEEPNQQDDDGWGDDDDLNDLELDDNVGVGEEKPPAKMTLTATASTPVVDGWGDDDEDFFGEEKDEDVAGQDDGQSIPAPSRLDSRLYGDIEAYILSLNHIGPSANALLDAEYNNCEKAAELCAYYAERPGLTAYTIEKELARMEYELILQPTSPRPITDKNEVARWLSQDRSLLSRCANQSILADLLQVLSAPDCLIRPQFMATAIAEACRFRIDMVRSLVQVQALLGLCLPTETGRWRVAEISVQVSFVPNPHQPWIEFRLESILPQTGPRDPSWRTNLESVTEIVSMMHPEENEEMMHPMAGPNFRDTFLQQSQNLLQTSAVGMHSAWKEFDSVTGLTTKLNRLPGFLPNDMIREADEHHNMETAPKQRPSSILGGFVRSGLTRLAQKVALPDEDPSLYQEWQPNVPHNQGPVAPQLYNRPTEPSRDHHEAPQSSLAASGAAHDQHTQSPKEVDRPTAASGSQHQMHSNPVLYMPESPPQSKAAHDQISFPSTRDTENDLSRFDEPSDNVVGDGWDDEDLDEDLIETTTTHATTMESPATEKTAKRQVDPFTPAASAEEVEASWVFDPVTDIMPTRKRWVNPRPGRRTIK